MPKITTRLNALTSLLHSKQNDTQNHGILSIEFPLRKLTFIINNENRRVPFFDKTKSVSLRQNIYEI